MKVIPLARSLRIGILAVVLGALSAAALAAQQTENGLSSVPQAGAPMTPAKAKRDTVPVTTASKEARHNYYLAIYHC